MRPADFSVLHKRAFEPEARGWEPREFEQFLADPQVIWIGDTRAFILARCIDGEAEVLTLACDPHHRRQGLARACVAKLIDKLGQRGVRRLFLEVAADNKAARALYSEMNFNEVSRRVAYYRRAGAASVDAVVLQKEMDPGNSSYGSP